MKRMLLVAFLTLLGGAASAQQTFSEVQRAALAQQQAQVRVNVGINMFVPAASGMGELAMATPALSDGVMYVRGQSTLFAIGSRR